MAALGPQMAALAGEIADGVLFNMAPPDYLTDAISGSKAAARRAGRDPGKVEIACNLRCAGDTPDGEWECRLSIGSQARLPFYQNVLRVSGFAADADRVIAAEDDPEKPALAVSDKLLDVLAVWGPPSKWWEKVPTFQRAGATLVYLRFRPSGPDARETLLGSIERFGMARPPN